MSTARKLPPDQEEFLLRMLQCDGGWLFDDPKPAPPMRTLRALERKRWVRLERTKVDGSVCCASLTALGLAACKWGGAKVIDGDPTYK